MIEHKRRPRPKPWRVVYRSTLHGWLVPILYLDWLTDWAAFLLSRTAFLDFLEYCGSFSILIAVVFYFVDAPQRTKLKHYQAWQVINTAQGKGGSGGRADALHELNEDHVPLVGVDLSDAFLQYLDLQKADLTRCKFSSSDLRCSNLSNSNLGQSGLVFTNFRQSKLIGVNFDNSDLTDADLTQADLTRASVKESDLTRADLRFCDLTGLANWQSISKIEMANIHGVKNSPEGFVKWATDHGAVDYAQDKDWESAIKADLNTPTDRR